jgi:hypothetical protein
MKLTKSQIKALANQIYEEVQTAIVKEREEIIKKQVEKFMKTDVGKAIYKVNTTFFDNSNIITNYEIERFAFKFYGTTMEEALPKLISFNTIENQIIINTIESNDLQEIISKVKETFNV